MKKTLSIFLVLVVLAQTAFAQKDTTNKSPESQIRKYWFVLLTRGNSRTQDSATSAKIQKGHLDNITRLYNEGKIKVAGPFGEKGDTITTGWQGIFIFDCATREELENLLNTDPAISAGRLAYHIRAWYTAPIGSFVPGKPKAPF